MIKKWKIKKQDDCDYEIYDENNNFVATVQLDRYDRVGDDNSVKTRAEFIAKTPEMFEIIAWLFICWKQGQFLLPRDVSEPVEQIVEKFAAWSMDNADKNQERNES